MINDSNLKCYRLNKFDKTDKMLTENWQKTDNWQKMKWLTTKNG